MKIEVTQLPGEGVERLVQDPLRHNVWIWIPF